MGTWDTGPGFVRENWFWLAFPSVELRPPGLRLPLGKPLTVDPYGELAGVYRRVGAGGTVQRPTRVGPAMLFEKVKGYDGARILVGLPAPRPKRPRARSVVRCECQ
ncbi:hypothetical protein [Streptomyces sp. CB02460]|uniref:hypothetical protein n=1 Tax=Streptomyces sp. CB02460 TaxID=1703941 RepID=UPI00095B49F7|nr:hypothetical protein [Streptomyces sp. CB02460]OKJ68739.1 hypothetical protein AMK30_30460 [Streptomyces sp. CB02460]